MLKVSLYTWKALSSDGKCLVKYTKDNFIPEGFREWILDNDPLAAKKVPGSIVVRTEHSKYREVTFVPAKESK